MTQRVLLIFFLCLFFIGRTMAQQGRQVIGSVTDTTGTVPGINVKLTSDKDSISVATGTTGMFSFPAVLSKTFKITVSGIGYQTLVRRYVMDDATGPIKLDPIKVKVQTNFLKTVKVVAEANPITIKEDTVEYKASSYKVREGSPVEDLLKKLPGVSVDNNGNVTAHGKQVTKVRVNGKDYFTGDVQTATQNLPADIVENIQVIDDYGDQANLTGIKTGDPDKILNITIQKGKSRGNFGQGSVGVGNDDRYQARLSANSFLDARQIAVIGTLNNTNTNSFNLGGSGGGGGRAGRGGGGGSGGSQISTANGITTNRSIGTNYRDDWSKKMTVYGSYSFADKDKDQSTITQQQNQFQSGTLINNDNSDDKNHGINHRFDFNMEYKIDTSNYLKINPSFSYGISNDVSTDVFSNMRNSSVVTGNELALTDATSQSGNLNVLYNHKFHKKGRNFSMNAVFGVSKSDQGLNDQYTTKQDTVTTQLFQQINSNNNSQRVSVHLSYMEPIGKSTYLEGNYNYSYTNTDNNRYNYRVDPITGKQTYVDSLSTIYNSQFITNRFGINLRGIGAKYNYTIGMAVQPSTLNGEAHAQRFNTNTFNYIPTARFIYNFSRNHSFTINYSGSNSQPSFTQLQLQPDYSNPQNRVYGNPDLKPSFTNNINLRYNQFDIESGNSLFTNLSFSETQNAIVTNTSPVYNANAAGHSTSTKDSTIQETHYLNTNGLYNVSGNYAFSKPFANRKFTITASGSAGYSNNVSYIEDQRNTGKNWVLSQGLKLRTDIDSVMDTEISGNYSINTTRYSLPSSLNTDASTWTLGIDGRNYFFYSWVLGYNLTQTINHGFSSTVKANPTLLSTYLEYQFLAKHIASLRFQAFDLFDENKGVSRTVSGNQIIDTRTNRLGRYFMLSFSLRLQKFKGSRPGSSGGGRRGGMGGGSRRGGGRG
ncbi:TonB-dependent receptor [Mucilaginibacter aquaedulcis]|uniref:TonB-dependent receptor n=1 Tax=Mucilaginibacter aquaedulcis TaxID=1187081 RepID=UPI0025B47E52|nr:TonB-dependent receptor [Mucilaginibacter aquaedulcis]MDN3547025.1 TonB-dependent receptor [Mucilaginibacter aquaedulcis]